MITKIKIDRLIELHEMDIQRNNVTIGLLEKETPVNHTGLSYWAGSNESHRIAIGRLRILLESFSSNEPVIDYDNPVVDIDRKCKNCGGYYTDCDCSSEEGL